MMVTTCHFHRTPHKYVALHVYNILKCTNLHEMQRKVKKFFCLTELFFYYTPFNFNFKLKVKICDDRADFEYSQHILELCQFDIDGNVLESDVFQARNEF